MENGVEALKMAFGMLIFVLAISISISCFGMASQTLQRIWQMQQEDESYVTDSEGNYLNYVNFKIGDGNREVGIETIIPTMYKAYKENFAIYFYDAGGNPWILHEENGNQINYIDLEQEVHANAEAATEHLKKILSDNHGELYTRLANNTFIEKLGEYYQDDVAGTTETADINKTKKRVIAYILNNKF